MYTNFNCVECECINYTINIHFCNNIQCNYSKQVFWVAAIFDFLSLAISTALHGIIVSYPDPPIFSAVLDVFYHQAERVCWYW
jgi:hypothetical protein